VNPNDVSVGRGWSPAYGAFSVLSQLQGFFAEENFAKLEKTLGSKVFALRVKSCRIAIANCTNPSVGHTPERPVPAVPVFNGPMRHAPEAVMLRQGAIRCRAAGEGNAWRHSYATGGTHRFRATIRKGGAVIGVTLEGEREDLSQLGKTDGSWAVDTVTGSLWCGGEERKVDDAAKRYFPLPTASTVDVTVKPAEGTIEFAIHGGAVRYLVDKIDSTGPFTPAYCLLTAQAAAEFAFYVAGAAIPAPSTPPQAAEENSDADGGSGSGSSAAVSPSTSAPPAASRPSTQVRCAVTFATTADGAVLCLGIEVTKRHRTFLPAEMHSTATYVALDAFPKIAGQRSPSGYRFDFALPLLLDSAHSARALPQLRKALSVMCRNPLASTMYDPPFRPQLACAVFAELLRGVIRDAVHAKTPDYKEAFVLYCRLAQAFAALAAESPAIVTEAQGTIAMGECSSTVVFAMSTIVDVAWPEVVKQALKVEFAGREPTTDVEAFALLKRSLPKLLVGGAMARSVRFASLPRAVESLGAQSGGPSAEILDEFEAAIATKHAVDSWEALCDFYGVSASAADVVAH
jgi:hypothetical protein